MVDARSIDCNCKTTYALIMKSSTPSPHIGLALGSGGSKGLAHIGVLKVLEREKIPIHCIAGTSIGALVGGAYAVKQRAEELENIVFSNRWHRIFDLMLDPSFQGGMNSGSKVENYIREKIGTHDFSSLNIPFSALATDLENGEKYVLHVGDLAHAIRISLSVPLIFQPVLHDGHFLADGGLSDPVPVDVARSLGADIVIAVNLDAHYFSKDVRGPFNLAKVAHRSVNILRYQKAKSCVANADIVLEPHARDGGLVGWKDFLQQKNAQDLIASGERAMEEKMEELAKLINAPFENSTPPARS